jgi:CPA1 family monovalent cation:H+ antiporter
VVTLVLQGLLLPIVVRWARLPRDTAVEEERRLAETQAIEEALAALPQLAVHLGTEPQVIDRLRLEYEEYLHVLHTSGEDAYDEPAQRHDQQYTALRLALLSRKRAVVVRLRDERRIDDIVLRQVQSRLDIEEVRLNRREAIE